MCVWESMSVSVWECMSVSVCEQGWGGGGLRGVGHDQQESEYVILTMIIV